MTAGASEDHYNVTYVDKCYANVFTLSNPSAADLNHVVGSAAEQVQPLFSATQSHATCPRTCLVEIYDEDRA